MSEEPTNRRRIRRTRVYELSDDGMSLVGYRYHAEDPVADYVGDDEAGVEDELHQAETLLAQGKAAEAAELAESLIERAPHNSQLFATLGKIALARGRLLDAERYYGRALHLDPNSEQYGRARAEVAERRQEAAKRRGRPLARTAPVVAGLDQPVERPFAALRESRARGAAFLMLSLSGIAALIAAGLAPSTGLRFGYLDVGIAACAVLAVAFCSAALDLAGLVRSLEAEMTGDVPDSFARQVGMETALLPIVAGAVNLFLGAAILALVGLVTECWPRALWGFLGLSALAVIVVLARGTEPVLWTLLWLGNVCYLGGIAAWAVAGLGRKTHWE